MASLLAFNLFEYLFGLGKELTKAYPMLFRASDDPTETEAALVRPRNCRTRQAGR